MVKNPTNQKAWHVLTTRARAEKKVHKLLIDKQIEAFLPLQKKLRQWKDRKKWVEMPVITGYCFVKIGSSDFEKVLQVDSVAGFVRFEGKPSRIPDNQVE